MKKDYDIFNIKLVIWDLDETVWNGTIGESKIEFKPLVLNLIKEFTTKGIMNSICSKNDFNRVKETFLNFGYQEFWDYFVFPSINWAPKGERVQEIIKNMNLREENVLFIDDNELNINEVKFYSPKIMTARPEQIKKISEELYLVNDYDLKHIRLKQYKILEKKFVAKSESSNEKFLKDSKIKICIKTDCIENLERIKKLISRTNQLNFTKFRDDDIENTIKNNYSAYIIAEDKYGNYGICGFFSLDEKENKLIHFLFSCRIMNMGIEQFIYSYLQKPKLDIQGEVASNLDYDVDWIEVVDNLEVQEKQIPINNNINILFKGPCDLYSTLSYIESDCNIDTEFPYWNKDLIYILAHTHTAFIEQTHKFSNEKLQELSMKFPFPNKDEFKTKFFDPKYNLIFLSLLTTTHSGIYYNKKDLSYAFFGYADCDITDENNWDRILKKLPDWAKEQNLNMLKEFKKEYIFGGNPPVEIVLNNLEYIKNNLNSSCELVLILGSEIPTNKILDGYENMAERHKILNTEVRKFASKNDIEIIELTDFIKSDEDYTTCINHFSRSVYVELAKKVIDISNKKLGKKYLNIKK